MTSASGLPTLSSWSEEGKPLRLLQQFLANGSSEPKALSCYGRYVPVFKQM
jgi:hypothetical protein